MASKRAIRRKECGSKIKYQTEQDAKYVAWRLGQRNGTQYTQYRCKHCHSYHVGHTPNHVRKQMGR